MVQHTSGCPHLTDSMHTGLVNHYVTPTFGAGGKNDQQGQMYGDW